MIPFLELYLKNLIEADIAYIKANSDIIDRMFSLVDKSSSDSFKTYLLNTNVRVVLGYPRNDPAVLPCYCLMLGGEDEEYEALGDYEEEGFYEEEDETGETVTVNSDIYGTFMNSNFRIECWADNGDLTVFLYYLLKFIFLRNRLNMAESAGVILPKISGGDLEPIPDYFPMYVFRRALSLSGKIENSYSIVDFEPIDSVNIKGTMVD